MLRFIGMYVILSGVLAMLLLLQLWPWHPKSAVGWIALFILAAPVTAVGEWLGKLVLENRFATSLGNNTAPDSVSWLRVAYGVAASLITLAAVGAILFSLGKLWG